MGKIFTEFGRRYTAKSGFIVSRVEYTKSSGGKRIACVHGGTDLFVRTVYLPNNWPIRVSITDSSGKRKTGERATHDIAGPCCIAGDIIAHSRELPLIEQGDFVVAHDTGGYYYSAWSYYNVRQAPPIYGFEEPKEGEDFIFTLLKKGQTVDDTLAF